MQIAIASGKGGTGKTTVATNLASVASRTGRSVAYLDCDVEEPNGHIFLKPEFTGQQSVGKLVPRVNADKCTLCGKCDEICQFSAIVLVGQKVLVYPELCHACGGCGLVCPADAITETSLEIGLLQTGRAGKIKFVQGLLSVGQTMSPPLIKAVRAAAPQADFTVIDAPPGTSCPVIESVRGTDIRSYCQAGRIPILQEIPDDRRLAEAYSWGAMACEALLPEFGTRYAQLLESVRAAEGSLP